MRVALVALALTLAACQATDEPIVSAPSDSTVAATPSSHPAAPAPYTDAGFLREMAAHHAMAVDMTTMAQTRATMPEIRTMAARMQADQTREIAEIEAWLRARGEALPDTAAGAHDAHAMGMPMTMAEFASAPDFDRAFLTSMLGHHASAVVMSARAITHSRDTDVQRLARAIVRAQSAEIADMQRLLDRAFPGAVSTAADSASAVPGMTPDTTATGPNAHAGH